MKLFEAEITNFPSGFYYTDNFIDDAEETLLIELIRTLELHTFVFRGYEAKRKVASFGYDYHFNDRSITKGEPIPEGFDFLLKKIAAHLGMDPAEFTELLVTEYPPGSVINWHRDAPPFDIVVGISLLSDCKFRLRPYDKKKQGRSFIKNLLVKRRSLYCMRGEARDEWEHSIDKTQDARYSITLRTLRK
jgi:alkylated DNA repair dioxygenase AlkB